MKLFVDEPTGSANGGSQLHRRIATARRGFAFHLWHRFAMLSCLGLPVLVACSDASGPGAPMSLHDIPPLPQLNETMADRTAEERGLAAEGAAVQREAAALRARTGKSALPPPPQPVLPPEPAPVPGRSANAALLPPNVEAAINSDRVRTENDDASLNAFLRQLVRRQPDRPGTRALAAAAEDGGALGVTEPVLGSDANTGDRPARKGAPLPPMLDNVLREMGIQPLPAPTADVVPAPTPVSAPPPQGATLADPAASSGAAVIAAGRGSLSVGFERDGAAVSQADADEVALLAGDARARGQHVVVVGHGASPDIALARARAVAQLLIRHGLPAQALSLRAGGEGQSVDLLTGAVAS